MSTENIHLERDGALGVREDRLKAYEILDKHKLTGHCRLMGIKLHDVLRSASKRMKGRNLYNCVMTTIVGVNYKVLTEGVIDDLVNLNIKHFSSMHGRFKEKA